MSDEELLQKWKRLVERVGTKEALALLMSTRKVGPSTAERLSGGRYEPKKPSRRTREALLEVVGKRAG